LFIITLGAEAVGTDLSVTTVDETVFVSAANEMEGTITTKRTYKEYFKYLIAFASTYVLSTVTFYRFLS
jgi:hypothetical protein